MLTMLTRLPALREELSITPGPHLADGQPSWTLHDPVRNLFFQIDWPSFELLSRWELGSAAAVLEDVNARTTLQAGADTMAALLGFLNDNQLLRPASGAAAQLAAAQARRRGSIGQWLLHNYLFFRIPLLKPDRLLSALLPWAAPLFSRGFALATVAAGLLGLLLVLRESERFTATLLDTLSWQGALAYGAAIVFAKVCHEFGHALTAKRYGCRVPTMGVAFLVLWPVAYTDTNEVWKLAERRRRLAVAGAGILTELAIAAWATLAWAALPEGAPKQIAFLLSTTTWISTVAINASPFMRFDGYFLLSDLLGLPNLHARAFALARWDLRERLFAFGEERPEHFPRRLHAGLVLFAWATWIYRLVLFLGIAALVYHFFIKAVGIALFVVEIGWFIALPLAKELQEWRARWPRLTQRRRARRSLLLAGLIIALCAAPMPARVQVAGLVEPERQLALYAPAHAQLQALPLAHGQRAQAGAPLAVMASPDLTLRVDAGGAREQQLQWQSAAAGLDAATRRDWQLLDGRLAQARAEQATVAADARRYAPAAPFAGTLVDVDPDLRPGDWLQQQELVGRLVSDRWQVVAYVDEDEVRRIARGDRALFIPSGLAGGVLRLSVASIDRDASRTLNEPELAALFGGSVLVREKNGLLYPERAVYRVVLRLEDGHEAPGRAWRGSVAIAGDWEAPLLRFGRAALALLWREAGF